ncbi:hemerythrin domain-containing protein [Segeticoccus rhizosphaerae]|uniref:hemerythrin domain-containing protein n=1 Tax=Segeticoccus rhizosphaerae TaxID=1104777 RepID=UPI0013969657|nr:hemerythrin domain-containing protein [Segeticoccus rhizosphaerae]
MTAQTVPSTTPATEPTVLDRHADEELAQQIRIHHAHMVDELDRLTAALRDAAPEVEQEVRGRLDEWFQEVLVPHADEEEQTTYHAASELPEGRLLVEAMVREHLLIKRLVALFGESEGVAAAAYGRAVYEAFESHQRKENEMILPLLLAAPGVSLADAVGGGHGHQTGHGHAHG